MGVLREIEQTETGEQDRVGNRCGEVVHVPPLTYPASPYMHTQFAVCHAWNLVWSLVLSLADMVWSSTR